MSRETGLKHYAIPDDYNIGKDGMSAIISELTPGNSQAAGRGLAKLESYAQQISKQFGIPDDNILQVMVPQQWWTADQRAAMARSSGRPEPTIVRRWKPPSDLPEET